MPPDNPLPNHIHNTSLHFVRPGKAYTFAESLRYLLPTSMTSDVLIGSQQRGDNSYYASQRRCLSH